MLSAHRCPVASRVYRRIPKEMILRARRRHRGYHVLLYTLLGFLLLLPLADQQPWLISLLLIALSVVIVGALSRFSPIKKTRQTFYLLGGVAIALEIIWHLLLRWSPVLGRALTVPHVSVWVAFLVLAVLRLVTTLVRERFVTMSVVLGAACGYLLIGVAGGVMLVALWVLHPSSIELITVPPAIGSDPSPAQLAEACLRASPALMAAAFNVLTTLGSPLLNLRSVASQVVTTLISISGQLYIAILIALLLGRVRRVPQ